MIIIICICVVTAILVCLSVMFKPEVKIKKFSLGTYWIISLIGALILLIFQFVPLDYVGSRLISNTAINPLKILVLFISMTFLSVFLDELGFFKYLANIALKKKIKKQITLFLILYSMIAILTIFTSNDIIILTFTPFICCFCKKAKINPLPYLFGEFFAANTWSMFLIIGNPTNIYLASSAGMDFFTYIGVMFLPTFGGGIVSLLIIIIIFYKELKKPIEKVEYENITLDKAQIIIGLIHLFICLILLSISSYLNIEMWIITFSLCISLILCDSIYKIIRKNSEIVVLQTIKRLPFSLIPFVLSMFVIALSLEYIGVTDKIALFLNKFDVIFSVGFSSFISANLINNIPMSVLFSSILNSSNFSQVNYLKGIYAAIIGSNIGAYFTPIGALAGIMWMSILKRFDIKINFANFVKYGSIASIPTLIISLLLLELFF